MVRNILSSANWLALLGKPQKKLFFSGSSTKIFTPLGLVVIRNFFFKITNKNVNIIGRALTLS